MDNKKLSQKNVNNAPAQTSTSGAKKPALANNKSNKTTLVGIICGALGLALGAVGVFAITQFLQKNPGASTICDCSKCQTSAGSSNLDFGFLKLENNGKNIIYSPLSIKNGLALLSAGAAGKTATEINNVLGDTEVPKYQNIPDRLSLANAVFIRDTFKNEVIPSYISTIQDNYNGEVIYDSFESSTNMDNWVSQKTFGLINNIGIQPSAADLRIVLTNALAIQMDWRSRFYNDYTHGNSFYSQDGSEIRVATMHKETTNGSIKYYTDDNITALSMPLDSTSDNINLDFIAVMPSDGVDNYIAADSYSNIDNIINNLMPANTPKDGIAISIPKFKFDYELDFKSDLNAMGIISAFNSRTADFSNMATGPLYVSDAVHKADISFSETGIQTAATTAHGFPLGGVEEEPQPVIINIDHPFLFLIRDADNGVVWFTGAVYQPNLWENNEAE